MTKMTERLLNVWWHEQFSIAGDGMLLFFNSYCFSQIRDEWIAHCFFGISYSMQIWLFSFLKIWTNLIFKSVLFLRCSAVSPKSKCFLAFAMMQHTCVYMTEVTYLIIYTCFRVRIDFDLQWNDFFEGFGVLFYQENKTSKWYFFES